MTLSHYGYSQEKDSEKIQTIRNITGLLRKLNFEKVHSVNLVDQYFNKDMKFISDSFAIIEIDTTIFARNLLLEDSLILSKKNIESDKNTSFYSSIFYDTYLIEINTLDKDVLSMSSGTHAMLGYYNKEDYKRVKFKLKLDFSGGDWDDHSKTYELRFEANNKISKIVATVTKGIGWEIFFDGKNID